MFSFKNIRTISVVVCALVAVYEMKESTSTVSQTEQSVPSKTITDPTIVKRTENQVQDTRDLCKKNYPGPGGKDDCVLAKKLLANPQYLKM